MSNVFFYAMAAILIAVIAVCLYVVFLYAWKSIDHGWTAFVGLRPVHLKQPVGSAYENKNHFKSYDSLGMFPTVDDPQLKDLAGQIDRKGGSKTHKARVALAMVQQYVCYVKDKKQYGKDENWVLPWQTIANKKGDCEDSAFVYAGILYNLGIDSVVVNVPGHVTVGVDLGKTSGRGFKFGGVFYSLAEPTMALPLFGAVSVTELKIFHIQITKPPDAKWVSELTG